MFGMLDYRAHKLYALLNFPFGLFIWFFTVLALPIIVYLATLASIQHTISNRIAQLAIGLVALEIASIVWYFIAKLIALIPTALFKFLIDPLPADGRTKDEAQMVVEGGQRGILLLKLAEPADHWSDDLIDQVSRMNLLQRTFFRHQSRRRMLKLRDYYRSNPSLPQTEYNANDFLRKHHLNMTVIEQIVCNPFWRNAVLKFSTIVIIWAFVPRL